MTYEHLSYGGEAMEFIEGATYFALVVGCPRCRTLEILPASEATKGIEKYIKKKERSTNKVENLDETGDYEVGNGGTAIEKYYCPECHIFFRFVADTSHEIIE